MFESAFRQYFSLQSHVGGGGPTTKAKIHGKGCLLTPEHVLTALHVWNDIKSRYAYPVISKYDGLYRASIVYECLKADLLILRAEALISNFDLPIPSKFPAISNIPIKIGQTVGFLSTLSLMVSEQKHKSHTALAAGHVSFIDLPESSGITELYVLSGCVIQPGMSGSSAFRPDGSMIGILVKTISFRADFYNPSAPIYVLPAISPLLPYTDEIVKALS